MNHLVSLSPPTRSHARRPGRRTPPTAASVIVASPDAPRTTSAPVPVRGPTRLASGVTRLRLGLLQRLSHSIACQQSLDQAKSRLPQNFGAHPGTGPCYRIRQARPARWRRPAHPHRRTPPRAQQKFTQPVPSSQLILLGSLACAHQIA